MRFNFNRGEAEVYRAHQVVVFFFVEFLTGVLLASSFRAVADNVFSLGECHEHHSLFREAMQVKNFKSMAKLL
jgi:hypothetical protein